VSTQTVVGIDLGTQHLKVVCYDFEDRQVVATGSAPLELYQDSNGVAEQQAQWWLDALHAAFSRIDPRILGSVVALGVSGQQHGFVPLDESGQVLAEVKLWCDTSTERECREITESIGGERACLDLTGNRILPGYTASKILWFRKNQPELYKKLATILLPHDYLNFYLTGERCMEAGDASGTGLLDIRNRRWSAGVLRAIDADRDLLQCLPPLRTKPGIIGTLSKQAAKTLRLPPATLVATGGGDNMMAAIGTGNIAQGRLTMSLGTSGTVYAYSDTPVTDPDGEIAAFCSSSGGWLPLLCSMNCTVATETMRRMLDTDLAGFEQQVSRARAGSGGVVTVPFYNGERSPNLPQAKACILGLDSHNSRPENLLRSAMEGATYALHSGIGRLKGLGVETNEIVLTGGGANSASWRQLVADVCAAPVIVLQQTEGAAFGAALQALATVDGSKLPELVAAHLSRNEAACCEPDPKSVDFYRQAGSDYRRAVAAVTPYFQSTTNQKA